MVSINECRAAHNAVHQPLHTLLSASSMPESDLDAALSAARQAIAAFVARAMLIGAVVWRQHPSLIPMMGAVWWQASVAHKELKGSSFCFAVDDLATAPLLYDMLQSGCMAAAHAAEPLESIMVAGLEAGWRRAQFILADRIFTDDSALNHLVVTGRRNILRSMLMGGEGDLSRMQAVNPRGFDLYTRDTMRATIAAWAIRHQLRDVLVECGIEVLGQLVAFEANQSQSTGQEE
jgi:hypothetical protein